MGLRGGAGGCSSGKHALRRASFRRSEQRSSGGSQRGNNKTPPFASRNTSEKSAKPAGGRVHLALYRMRSSSPAATCSRSRLSLPPCEPCPLPGQPLDPIPHPAAPGSCCPHIAKWGAPGSGDRGRLRLYAVVQGETEGEWDEPHGEGREGKGMEGGDPESPGSLGEG